jgi:hypothetical protein
LQSSVCFVFWIAVQSGTNQQIVPVDSVGLKRTKGKDKGRKRKRKKEWKKGQKKENYR